MYVTVFSKWFLDNMNISFYPPASPFQAVFPAFFWPVKVGSWAVTRSGKYLFFFPFLPYLSPSIPSLAVISMQTVNWVTVIVLVHRVHFSPKSEWTTGDGLRGVGVSVCMCGLENDLLPAEEHWGQRSKWKKKMSEGLWSDIISICVYYAGVLRLWASLWAWVRMSKCVRLHFIFGHVHSSCVRAKMSLLSHG